ncbi:MAG: DUF262 domain-containing protein [Anaerolineales bacterium]|nr:DUF262 domain-containing protein [Anaerolineales bacterium]
MSFERPVTIKEAIDNVHRKKYLLPAIQREFVWSAEQIELLFDSMMRGYPIGSFLFWAVERQNLTNYQFYEFVRDYHERDNTHNPKADILGDADITAILDGQQRLTALYIGLKGSYAYKLPRKRWDNDTAFPKRKLCLNLLSPSQDYDKEYNFEFLTATERKHRDDNTFWFSVGDILEIKEPHEVNDFLIENGLNAVDKEKAKFANRTLFRLHKLIHADEIINYFLEKDESLDKVLNIFIRVNSGGTELSYSDLLLSIATAQWKQRDAREEITAFVDEINGIGNGFNFNKDFALKSCLVLSDFGDIAFKVDNFNSSNMLKIEKNWDDIAQAIRLAVTLVASLGYYRDTLTSNNALIPIAYYLYKIGLPNNYPQASKYKDDRQAVFKWLIASLLKRVFSGQPDNVLRPIRQIISTENSDGNVKFPLEKIANTLRAGPKSINFNDDEIDNLLYYQYGQSYTFSTLAILYPTLDFNNKFHVDHIFPKSLFTRKRLLKQGVPSSKLDFYLDCYNYLGNLQLLEGVQNQEKSAKDFKEWLSSTYPKESDRNDYMRKHFIPDVDLSLHNFEEFLAEREKLLVNTFSSLLKM